MIRLYVWWFDGLWRHTVCHNPTTANLLDRMLQAAGHETQIIEGTTMSDGYKSATEWKQGISAALGVMPGGWNYSLDGAVEKIEDLMRDSAARERERARAANPSLPEPDATNPDHLRFCADILDPMDGAVDSIYLRARADRLDAAQSDEREREQRIEAVAKVLADFTFTSERDTAARALEDAGLLRDGVR